MSGLVIALSAALGSWVCTGPLHVFSDRIASPIAFDLDLRADHHFAAHGAHPSLPVGDAFGWQGNWGLHDGGLSMIGTKTFEDQNQTQVELRAHSMVLRDDVILLTTSEPSGYTETARCLRDDLR